MKKYHETASKTNSGIISFFETIIRSHPLLYLITRSLIRYTNIFEEDAEGVKWINFKEKINRLDVGASDGIASKFFFKNLNVNKIFCFEPDKDYVKILKRLKNKNNLIIKPYAIGNKNEELRVYYPEYNFFNNKIKLITLCYYNKNLLAEKIKLDFKFRKNIKIVTEKLEIKKIVRFKERIDLIKIDVNGFEFSVVKGLIDIIKKDKPALIIETGKDTEKIHRMLKKLSYKKFIYKEKNLQAAKNEMPLNMFFLQKKHF